MRPDGGGRPRASGHARMAVLDYFNLGLQRGKHGVTFPAGADVVVGDVIRGSTGLTLRYQLHVDRGVIQQVSFKAPTCVTLVAYCEVLAQWATGMSLREAICIRADEHHQPRLHGYHLALVDVWLHFHIHTLNH